MPASQIRKATDLLRDGESVVPDAVARSERFLAEAGIWHRLARNSEATSCRDAAARRERLGATGIPIWDELKSLAFVGETGRLVLVHCRGDEEVDIAAVVLAAGETLTPASDEYLTRLGLGYGLINPFSVWETDSDHRRTLNIFDTGLLQRIGVPGTLMTNAGDRTWAVEFLADELVGVLDESIIADVVAMHPTRPTWAIDERPLGIVTGNSPESGIMLLEYTLDQVRSRLGRHSRGDVSMPPVQLASVPAMGLSMELSERAEAVLEAVSGAVEKLCKDGCRVVAIACNTTQFFKPELDEICSRYDARFLSMPEVVASWLEVRDVRRVGLIGIQYVSDLAEWSAYRPAFAGRVDVETPSDWGMRRIEEIGYRVKTEGVTSRTESQLGNLLRDVVDAEFRSDHVIVALTELSLLLERMAPKARERRATVLIDPLHVYAEALACEFLGLPFPEPEGTSVS